jgi:NADH-quinone oxidoreductase subunit H
MITISAIGANLFFGGWLAPVPALQRIAGVDIGVLWFLAKLFAGLFFFVWLRGTLPRFRYDQLMHFGWKALMPLAVLNVLLTAAAVVLLG